jgi:prepilin-type N-terminal cleavage/methylation domain-containing protein
MKRNLTNLGDFTIHPHNGFILTELLVVILIIGILSAVAVPLYTDYTKKAKITEATSTVGAIITSEKLEMQRVPSEGFYSAADQNAFKSRGLDLSGIKYFTYSVTATGGPPAKDFVVSATATDQYSAENPASTITYTYSTKTWSSTGSVTADMLPQ